MVWWSHDLIYFIFMLPHTRWMVFSHHLILNLETPRLTFNSPFISLSLSVSAWSSFQFDFRFRLLAIAWVSFSFHIYPYVNCYACSCCFHLSFVLLLVVHCEPKIFPVQKQSDSVASVTSSSNVSAPAKSQVVTIAPTATSFGQKSSASSIPPLKQKTGIVKSKVPPPVPPRGSPRDRRESSGAGGGLGSAHGTPSISGSFNYLNDKYFDSIRPNPNNSCKLTPIKLLHSRRESTVSVTSPPPIFGDRRSPTCVRDWLEVNDFNASNYERNILERNELAVPVECISMKPLKSSLIRTAILRRENSFRMSNSSGSSVRMMVKNYSKSINNKYKFMQKNVIRDVNVTVDGLDVGNQQFVPDGHVNTVKNLLKTRNIVWCPVNVFICLANQHACTPSPRKTCI